MRPVEPAGGQHEARRQEAEEREVESRLRDAALTDVSSCDVRNGVPGSMCIDGLHGFCQRPRKRGRTMSGKA